MLIMVCVTVSYGPRPEGARNGTPERPPARRWHGRGLPMARKWLEAFPTAIATDIASDIAEIGPKSTSRKRDGRGKTYRLIRRSRTSVTELLTWR